MKSCHPQGRNLRATRGVYEIFDYFVFSRFGNLPKVVEILCNQEGTAVSSGLSEYFGDSEETVAEAVANERSRGAAAAYGVDGGSLLSDVLTPPEVRCPMEDDNIKRSLEAD